MAVAVSRWYDEVAVNTPGVSNAAMQQAVVSTIQMFLRESAAYVKEAAGISVLANTATYQIPAQAEGPMLYIMALVYKGRPIDPIVSERWRALSSSTSTSPRCYRGFVDTPGLFELHPTPSVNLSDPIYPYVALGYDPAQEDELPNIFVSHWYDYILSGTISRLCSQQNKPYTDATLAVIHGRRFRDGISTARDMARKQFVQQDVRVPFPRWAP